VALARDRQTGRQRDRQTDRWCPPLPKSHSNIAECNKN